MNHATPGLSSPLYGDFPPVVWYPPTAKATDGSTAVIVTLRCASAAAKASVLCCTSAVSVNSTRYQLRSIACPVLSRSKVSWVGLVTMPRTSFWPMFEVVPISDR